MPEVKLCKVDIKCEGDEFIAVVTHDTPPIGDNRKEVPAKELRARSYEELFTEVKKYLEDCYDD